MSITFRIALNHLIWAIIVNAPSLAALAVCTIVGVNRWKRHPLVSALAIVSSMLLILHALLFAALYDWGPNLYVSYAGVEYEAYAQIILILNVLYYLTLAFPFALLLASGFIRRSPAPATSAGPVQ